MRREQTLAVLFILGLVYFIPTDAQLACSSLTVTDLGNTTAFSTTGLIPSTLVLGGEASSPVPVQISNYRILCDASGSMRGTSSYVSVLVQFQCDFSSGSGNLAMCDGTTMITRQYQFSCGAGDMWTTNIFSSTNYVQTLSPTATFSTTPSNQCRACVDDQQFPSNQNIDNTTHCFRKYLMTSDDHMHFIVKVHMQIINISVFPLRNSLQFYL